MYRHIWMEKDRETIDSHSIDNKNVVDVKGGRAEGNGCCDCKTDVFWSGKKNYCQNMGISKRKNVCTTHTITTEINSQNVENSTIVQACNTTTILTH